MAGIEADEVGSDIVVEVLRYKSGNNSGTIGQNELTFGHNLPWGCPNCRWCHHISASIMAPLQCHQQHHLHSEGSFGQQNGLTVNQTT